MNTFLSLQDHFLTFSLSAFIYFLNVGQQESAREEEEGNKTSFVRTEKVKMNNNALCTIMELEHLDDQCKS